MAHGLFESLRVWDATNGQYTDLLDIQTTELTGMSGASVSASNLIPAGSIVLGVTCRVTTTITGATTFDVGDGTDVDKFGAAIALSSGTTTDLTDHSTTTPVPFLYTAATSVVLTANGSNFTAGAVRVSVHCIQLTAPLS